jgi:hypothetical protein
LKLSSGQTVPDRTRTSLYGRHHRLDAFVIARIRDAFAASGKAAIGDRRDDHHGLVLGTSGNGESAPNRKALNADSKLQTTYHNAFLSPGFSFKNSALLKGIDFYLHPAN